MKFYAIPGFLVLMLLSSPAAFADLSGLVWSGQVSGSARDLNGPNIWGVSCCVMYHDNGNHSLTEEGFGDFGSHGFGTIQGNAGYGNLHAQGSGSSWVNDTTGTNLTTSFFDTVTIGSATLAFGTPVSVRFTASLHDTLMSTNPDPAPCNVTTGANCASASALFTAPGGSLTITDVLGTPSPTGPTGTFLALLQVGQTFQINGSLTIATATCSHNEGCRTNDPSFTQADASNTALFNMDSLTPDVFLTTNSGTDYATNASAVPEPSLRWVLVIAISLGLILHRTTLFRKKKLTA
jgi:hypothetical protein